MRGKIKKHLNIMKLYLISPFYNKGLILFSLVITNIWEFIEYLIGKIGNLKADENWKETILILIIATFIFQIIDMLTAIFAARHTGKSIRSMKLDATLFKFGVSVLGGIISFLFLSLFGINYATKTVVYGMYIVYISREFQSIGENLEMRYGQKFEFFNIFENVIDFMNKYILDRIKKKKE